MPGHTPAKRRANRERAIKKIKRVKKKIGGVRKK